MFFNIQTFAKGTPARQILQLTGGTVLTSEEKYCALVDKAFPDLNSEFLWPFRCFAPYL